MSRLRLSLILMAFVGIYYGLEVAGRNCKVCVKSKESECTNMMPCNKLADYYEEGLVITEEFQQLLESWKDQKMTKRHEGNQPKVSESDKLFGCVTGTLMQKDSEKTGYFGGCAEKQRHGNDTFCDNFKHLLSNHNVKITNCSEVKDIGSGSNTSSNYQLSCSLYAMLTVVIIGLLGLDSFRG